MSSSNPIKEIYLIRHGETAYNKMGVVQGSGIDADLNELGREQAKAFFEYYKDLKFDKIYISNLVRTFQTVESFLDLGIPFEKHEGLNEISWGHKEGKIPNDIDNAYYKDLIDNWNAGNTHLRSEGGESPEDVSIRQDNALEIILERNDESLILIAMHGRAMRVLLTKIANQELKYMDNYEHRNTCLYKIQYHKLDKTFKILEQNNIEHLERIMA
jgi:2,3-bisphosphoglycerate-dependent phosphoglycerate mutase